MTGRIKPGIGTDLQPGIGDIADFTVDHWHELERPLLVSVRRVFAGLPLVLIVAGLREAGRRRGGDP